jgi:hypothetical protein
MRHVLRAGTELKHRQDLGERIDGEPEPQHLLGAAEPGAQLVPLEIGEMEMAEELLVQGLSVLARTTQPGGNGGVSKAEDALGGGRVEPFGQRREHHGDLVRRGFQTVQRRVASGCKGGTAGLTPERLDALNPAVLAIADEGVEGSVGVAIVPALLVGTSEARGIYPDGGLLGDFSLQTRDAQQQALALHSTRAWS